MNYCSLTLLFQVFWVREREGDRERGWKTKRQTDRDIEAARDRQTERHRGKERERTQVPANIVAEVNCPHSYICSEWQKTELIISIYAKYSGQIHISVTILTFVSLIIHPIVKADDRPSSGRSSLTVHAHQERHKEQKWQPLIFNESRQPGAAVAGPRWSSDPTWTRYSLCISVWWMVRKETAWHVSTL